MRPFPNIGRPAAQSSESAVWLHLASRQPPFPPPSSPPPSPPPPPPPPHTAATAGHHRSRRRWRRRGLRARRQCRRRCGATLTPTRRSRGCRRPYARRPDRVYMYCVSPGSAVGAQCVRAAAAAQAQGGPTSSHSSATLVYVGVQFRKLHRYELSRQRVLKCCFFFFSPRGTRGLRGLHAPHPQGSGPAGPQHPRTAARGARATPQRGMCVHMWSGCGETEWASQKISAK